MEKNKIKEKRLELKMTQTQLSEMFGISIDVVKGWDSGRSRPVAWAEKLLLTELEEIKKDKKEYEEIIMNHKIIEDSMKNIKEKREECGISQQQFAEIFGMSINVVKSWDCGRRKPPAWVKNLIIKKLEDEKNT